MKAHSLLKREKNSAQEWILSGFKSGLDDVLENSDVSKAIDVFLEHLRLILEGTYEDEGDNKLSLFDQFMFSISDIENSNSSITKPKGIGQDINKYVRDLTKFIDDVIDLIDSDLIDHLHQIEEEAKADILRNDLIEEAVELLNEARAKMDRSSGRKLRKLSDSLENILDSLDEGLCSYKRARLNQDMFRMRNRTAKHYFSWLLSEIPVFMEDAPYCFIERVFENPHDKPINVEIREGKDSRRIKQSMHQFMRDMLPGSWNHRLSKSGTGHSLSLLSEVMEHNNDKTWAISELSILHCTIMTTYSVLELMEQHFVLKNTNILSTQKWCLK